MSVKPIRPGVTIPAGETDPAIIAVIDALKDAAAKGVITTIAATWCMDDEYSFDFAHDGAPTQLAGAAHVLALQITSEAAFDD